MDEYIYIIGAIAYIAYSIYSASQKQKKKQQQAQNPAQPYARPEVRETAKKEPQISIFEEIIGINENDFSIEEELFGVRKAESNPDPIKAEEKPEKLDNIPKEEGVRTTEHKTNKNAGFSFGEEKEEENNYEFNLRDAIIASEILNPPYIER